MSLEVTGMELAPAALRHTLLQSCTIIIVRRNARGEGGTLETHRSSDRTPQGCGAASREPDRSVL